MTEQHWKILIQLLWQIGAVGLRDQKVEAMMHWHEAIEIAKNLPWKSEPSHD